mmetsp:Transcript_11306/g.26830  ORF Transcript_11306/g.26830 Transcript_11306/m.26830 type:complete len:212 (-) Transcript_11306:397-1032(-)
MPGGRKLACRSGGMRVGRHTVGERVILRVCTRLHRSGSHRSGSSRHSAGARHRVPLRIFCGVLGGHGGSLRLRSRFRVCLSRGVSRRLLILHGGLGLHFLHGRLVGGHSSRSRLRNVCSSRHLGHVCHVLGRRRLVLGRLLGRQHLVFPLGRHHPQLRLVRPYALWCRAFPAPTIPVVRPVVEDVVRLWCLLRHLHYALLGRQLGRRSVSR